MRLIPLVYNVLDKFAPMAESERTELRNDANSWYLEQRKEIFEEGSTTPKLKAGISVENLKPKQKLLYWCEHWAVRTCFAVAYIFLIPTIRDFMLGVKDETPEKEDSGFLL